MGISLCLETHRASDDRFVLILYKSLPNTVATFAEISRIKGESPIITHLANLVGLIYLGLLCPEFMEAAEWREFGLTEIEAEMQKQVYADGVSYEASTSYHRLALEMFLRRCSCPAYWTCLRTPIYAAV